MSTFSKPNLLIESHCTFSIYGHRIVNNIISKYNNKDSDIKVFGIDFKDFIGKNASGSQYTIAKKVLTELKSQYYEYQKSHNNIIKIYPFESCNIVNGHPRIEITITSEFLEVLKLYNSSNYTILNYDNIFNMTSTHSIRIYELLQQYYNTDNKYRILELKDLKYYLGITKEYCNYYDFKRVVINTGLNNLNKHTNIIFELEEIKNGNKVVKLKFKILDKVEKSKDDKVESFDVLKYFKNLYGVIKTDEYLKNYKIEYLKSAIDYAVKNCKKNIKTFLSIVIKDNPMNFGLESIPVKTPQQQLQIPKKIDENQVKLDKEFEVNELKYNKLSKLQKEELFQYCKNSMRLFTTFTRELQEVSMIQNVDKVLSG